VKGFDIDPAKTLNRFDEVLDTEVVFLALPTPLNEKGRLDASLVSTYLEKFGAQNYRGLVVIKSTLPLGYLNETRKRVRNSLRILYGPEFLHQKNAMEEMLTNNT